MIDEFNLLKPEPIIEPCARTTKILDAHGSSRTFNLSALNGPRGKCTWCDKTLSGQRRKWCSDACVRSAQFRCFPQSPDVKMWRLIRLQNCACAGCGESYELEIRKRILDIFNSYNRYKKPGQKPELVSFYAIGNNTGDRWQTDHRVPIHRGGKGICPNNLQVLCTPCHVAKTSSENKSGVRP